MSDRIFTDANGRKYINNEPRLHPPKRMPLTNYELEICIGYRLPDAGFDAIRELIEAAHDIGEKP